jgi:hypothetical protein
MSDDYREEQRRLVERGGREALERERKQLKLNGSRKDDDNEIGSEYEFDTAFALIAETEPVDYIVDGIIEAGANVGLVAPPESGKSLLALNIAACVATGKQFHGREVTPGIAAYLLGEGRAGFRRRIQALENRHRLGLGFMDGDYPMPLIVSRKPAALLDPKEVLRIDRAIREREEYFGQPFQLLVVDTLSRFIAPGKDSASEDMSAYFNAVDYLRRDAAVITLHHPGHLEKQRGRGSSVWTGALDAEFSIAKAGDQQSGEILTVTCHKMKDGEKPAPFSYRVMTGPSSTKDRAGNVMQSVFLEPTDIIVSSAKATGKNQINLAKVAADYKKRTGSDLISGIDLRQLAKDAGIDRRRFLEAASGLERVGLLRPATGGWTIGD